MGALPAGLAWPSRTQDPAQSPPCRHLRILVGRRAGLPRGPKNDNQEMLRLWVLVRLGPGERAVHWAPSPAAGGGPQLIQNDVSPVAGRKDRWKSKGRARRGGRGKEKMEERRGERRGGKEQTEGKEGGKEERKVKTEGRGAQAKPGEGEAGPGKGPRPLP